jgi:hypothetical protein
MIFTNDIKEALFGNGIHPKPVSIGKIGIPILFSTVDCNFTFSSL